MTREVDRVRYRLDCVIERLKRVGEFGVSVENNNLLYRLKATVAALEAHVEWELSVAERIALQANAKH